MKNKSPFALAFIALNAMIALNETGPLAQAPAMTGPGNLSSPNVGLSSDAHGAFPYLDAHGPRSSWLSSHLAPNGRRPRFDAQDSYRRVSRVRFVVTGTPQSTCNWAPSFPPFGGHPIPVINPTWGCQQVTGYSRALVEAFAALDVVAKMLVRESMVRSDYYQLEWAAAVVEQNRRTPVDELVVVSDSDLNGHEVDLSSF